jgi:hypothetical protein
VTQNYQLLEGIISELLGQVKTLEKR